LGHGRDLPWPAKDRRVPWRDLVMRAKTDPTWPWMPGARGLEVLRDEALKQGRWRQSPEGHIEKGPFPAEKTSVNVTPLGTNRETGETSLSLTPRNAGDSPSFTSPTQPLFPNGINRSRIWRTTAPPRRRFTSLRWTAHAGTRRRTEPLDRGHHCSPRTPQGRGRPQGRASRYPSRGDALHARWHQPQGGLRLCSAVPGARQGLHHPDRGQGRRGGEKCQDSDTLRW
jgi:hypothetical protein